MRAPRHHVLLIGIDAYPGTAALAGCVSDVEAVGRLLVARARVPLAHVVRLLDGEATLANLRAAFDRLDSDVVGEGDRVFVYYSGHGTQSTVIDRGGRRFSREALVPVDGREGGARRYLFDFELNARIAAIAARTSAVTIVLDCCSSAGATRGELDGDAGRDRFLPPNDADVVALDGGAGDPTVETLRGLQAGLGRVSACQVVAACRDEEKARETRDGQGTTHGLLTRALVQQLATIPDDELGGLRWGRVWRQVDAEVRAANAYQHPWISGSFGRRVLGLGPDADGDPGFAVEPAGARYRLDVGELAGVTEDAEIAVYGATPLVFSQPGSAAELAERAGTLRVVAPVGPSRCEAEALAPFALPVAPRGRLIKPGKAARLRVAAVPHDAALAAALASPLIEWVGEGAAELVLRRRADERWALTDDVHGTGEDPRQPWLGWFRTVRPDLGRSAIEHYHAYLTPLRMARAAGELPGAMTLAILDCNGPPLAAADAQSASLPQLTAALRAPYEIAEGDKICFSVENLLDAALSVTLVDCAASGRVLLLGEKRLPGRTRHRFWANESLGAPFSASAPRGHASGVDRVVAIGTTRADVSLAHLARRTTFEELLREVRSAGLDAVPVAAARAPAERWTAAITAVRINARR